VTAIGRAGKRYLRRAGHCAYEPAIEPEPAAPQPWAVRNLGQSVRGCLRSAEKISSCSLFVQSETIPLRHDFYQHRFRNKSNMLLLSHSSLKRVWTIYCL
jgi:hypothetical protein